jgi:Ca2+-binding RTX toxin-like protein
MSTVGTEGNDVLVGTDADDTLIGLGGDDDIDGAGGNDTMIGGPGDDWYHVDSALDVVVEKAGEGEDWVLATTSFTLPSNADGNHAVENLVLGGAADNGTGNELNNAIFGNERYNTLTGGAGDDYLDGAWGPDLLIGGTGNDTYVVDDANDQIVERPGEGDADGVVTYVNNYTLPRNIENLTLGPTAHNGNGNEGDNVIAGNGMANTINGGGGDDQLYGYAGYDTLDGGPGEDVMRGGLGNDAYFVDNAGDQVIELRSEGTDTVNASVNYTLPENVENLTLLGVGPLRGLGNDANNTIVGNAGDNTLGGGLGRDTLSGGAGSDRFVFDTPASSGNADTVLDFDASDRLIFEPAVFPGLTADGRTLAGDVFASGPGLREAATAAQRLVFDTTTSTLSYDPDGAGGAPAVPVVRLQGVAALAPEAIGFVSHCTGDALTAQPFAGGSGTLGDPFLICTAAQLDQVRNFATGGRAHRAGASFVLGADIDLAGVAFAPIASFGGTFDGAHHTVSNFTAFDAENDVGFFADLIIPEATVQDLTLAAVDASGPYQVGAIAGTSAGTIRGCSASGRVHAPDGNPATLGGLVGFNTGVVTHSQASVDVDGPSQAAGGLVGGNTGGVAYSAAFGNVRSSAGYGGGLVGLSFEGDIRKSFATGDVTSPSLAGQLVGLLECNVDCSVTNAFATGAGADGLLGAVMVGQDGVVITLRDLHTVGATKAGITKQVGSGTGTPAAPEAFVLSGLYFGGSATADLGATGTPVTNLGDAGSYPALDFAQTWIMGPGFPVLRSDELAATCRDGVKNGDESDVDCGGTTCGRCGDQKQCAAPSDCGAGASCSAGICDAPSCGGSGTPADPWKVCRLAHLETVRARPGDAFLLMNDLDLLAVPFAPLDSFSGRFDGGGHAIKNWSYTGGPQSQYGSVGFFRDLYGGSVMHLRLQDVVVTATDGYYVGGLVGRTLAAARVHDCQVTGQVTMTHSFAWGLGGLVGYDASSQVSICTRSPWVGAGLLISHSSADVTLTARGTPWGAGALFGSSGNGQIRAVVADSLATGRIDAPDAYYSGGISAGFGGGWSGLTVLRSLSTVSGARNGIVQLNGQYGSVGSSFWDIARTGTTTSAGGGTGLSSTEMQTAATFSSAGWSASDWLLADGSYPALTPNAPPPPRVVACDDGSLVEYEGVCPFIIDRSGVRNGPNCP